MEFIKRITQSFTGLIFWPIVIGVVPFSLAIIGDLLGLWAWVDSHYPEDIKWFIVWMILTRALYLVVWAYLVDNFHKVGVDKGFFWFKEEKSRSSNEPEPVDKSGRIVNSIYNMVILLWFIEVVIRLSTWTFPPYFQ